MPAVYSFTSAVRGLSKFSAAKRSKFFCLTYRLTRKRRLTEAHWEQVGAVAVCDSARAAGGVTGARKSRQTSVSEGDSK